MFKIIEKGTTIEIDIIYNSVTMPISSFEIFNLNCKPKVF